MVDRFATDSDAKPWYKQGWPWFIISIPLATVIAGVITLIIASREPSSMVVDDYFKRGLAINQSLAKQEQARANLIKGEISFSDDKKSLTLSLSEQAKISNTEPLKIRLFHPTKADKDISLTLHWLTGKEFVAELPPLEPVHWYLSIEAERAGWAVKTRWDGHAGKISF